MKSVFDRFAFYMNNQKKWFLNWMRLWKNRRNIGTLPSLVWLAHLPSGTIRQLLKRCSWRNQKGVENFPIDFWPGAVFHHHPISIARNEQNRIIIRDVFDWLTRFLRCSPLSRCVMQTDDSRTLSRVHSRCFWLHARDNREPAINDEENKRMRSFRFDAACCKPNNNFIYTFRILKFWI